MKNLILIKLVIIIFCLAVSCKTKKERMEIKEIPDEAVARVGDDFIYAYEIEKKSPKYSPGLISPEQDFKVKYEILNNLIEKKLFELEGYSRGLAPEIDYSSELEAIKIAASIQKLYEKEILDKIIPEERLKEEYSRMKKIGGIEVHARHIVVKKIKEARDIIEKLFRGENFETLAMQFSIDRTNVKGGDLGWVSRGDIPYKSLEDVIFNLKPGEISRNPVQTPAGYHIVQVIETREKEFEPYEMKKDQIRQQLGASIKDSLDILAIRFADSLFNAYNTRINQDVYNLLLQRTREAKPVPKLAESSLADATTIPKFSDEEKKMIIAFYDGGAFTINDYLDRLQKISPHKQPKGDDPAIFDETLKRMLNNVLLWKEARKKGLDKDPFVSFAVENRRQAYEAYKKEKAGDSLSILEITSKIKILPEEAQKYFLENRSKYASKDDPAPEFSSVQERVIRDLTNFKADQIKAELIDKYKKKWGVQIFEDNFKKFFLRKE